MTKRWEAYYKEVHRLEGKFDGIELHVLRRDEANALAKLASTWGRPS
jgi:hypothetical protein